MLAELEGVVQNRNALEVARFLEQHPAVVQVYPPVWSRIPSMISPGGRWPVALAGCWRST